MSLRDRRLRYGTAAGLIVVGFACGAIMHGAVGYGLATAFIAAGLIMFVAMLLSDLGLSDRTDPRPRVPPPPSQGPPGDDHTSPS